MADNSKPLVTINIANIFKQLHDIAIEQSKKDLPKGYVIKNLAFSDDKATEMKAGEYLITLAPEDEMDKSLFLDDKLRPAAENALKTYIKFFVDKDVNPKEFSEILVDTSKGEDDKKKDSKQDNANEKPQAKPEEKKEKATGESLKTKQVKNSLLNILFEDYQYLNEEGEGKPEDKPEDAAGDKKDEKPEDKPDDEKSKENKDGKEESSVKVRGLSAKYTCEIAGQKTGKLAAAMKKGAKSLFGGIWNDLTQIKITGGVFGKDGLAIGKVLDPDAWKEATGRPDIDANTIKSDIDTVFQKDYPNNSVAVKVHKCSGLMSLIKKCGAKASSALVKAMSEADLCIAITTQKKDENYDSYNEESIAEVINKSIGNYYKSIITHPLKFTVSKDDVYKVENFSEDGKRIDTPKDKQTPNKPAKESMSFLTYCALVNTGKILLEDAEEPESADDKKQADESKPDESKISDVKDKFEKNVESAADASQVDINSIKSDYGTVQDIKIKVKKLEPVNAADIDKITGDGTTAFFVDFKLKDTVKDSMIERYPSMLKQLFESQYLLEENEIKNTQQETFIKAINDTAKQIKKDIELKDDISPTVFNYSNDTNDEEKSATGESLSRNLRLLKFIYKDNILNESHILLEKADPIVLKCFDEIDRVGFENISKDIDKFRDAWQENIVKAKEKLPDELAKRSENSEGYLNYLKKKYVKGADGTPFDKNVISKLRKATSTIQVKNLFASYGSNNNETEFNKDPAPDKASETIPEYYAAWQALKALPSQKKIKVTFYTSDEDGKKKDEIDTITIVPGKSIDEISDGDNKDTISSFKDLVENDPPEGMRFDGYEPPLDTKLTDDTDVIAKYAKKDAPVEIEFYDVDPENPDDESKWKDIDIQELNPENPSDIEFPAEDKLGKHEGWKFEKWDPTEEELKKNPPKTATKVKATYSKSTVTISLYDADPETGEKKDDPIETYEIEKGTAPNTGKGDDIISKANEELQKNVPDGFENKGWQPDPSEKVEEDTVLVAKYSKKDVTHEVKFMAPTDPDDPSTAEDIGEPQKVNDGESAEAPEPPEVEGWKFDKWDSDDWQNVKDDIVVLAEYKKPVTITFKVPTDPEKPDGEMEEVGDPITYEEGKPIEAPEPPEKEGYEFEKWDPNPDDLQPEESTDVIGTYKKADDIEITFKVPKDPENPDGDTEQVGDPIIYKDGEEITPPEPPEKDGYEFEKWDPDPATLKPEESTDVIGTYKKADEKSNGTLHEVYVVIDPYNLAQADKKNPESYYIYRPKDPSKLGDKKKDGSIDVENGNYTLAQKDPIQKTDDDSFNDAIEKLIPKGYEKENPSSGFAYDGIEEVKKPKDGEPGIMVMKFKDTKEGAEGYDLYVYASKKIKYKNEKTVGRKEKKMQNGNAYST